MGREWTIPQKSAIEDTGHTLLISAAAGSGKTAVLTARIIRTLTDEAHPADLSRILAVTFTRAAAAELRARISKALTEELAKPAQAGHAARHSHLSRQLMLLGGAQISTIDAFYLNIVRAHFADAGLPATFRIADEGELLPLRKDLMRATIEKAYEDGMDLSEISDVFCDFRSEDKLGEKLLEIVAALDRIPAGISFLQTSADAVEQSANAPLATPYGAAFLDTLRRFAREAATLTGEARAALPAEEEKMTLKYRALLDEMQAKWEALVALSPESDCAAVLALIRPLEAKIGNHKCTPTPHFKAIAELLKAAREEWNKKITPAMGAFSAEEVAESGRRTAALLRTLHGVLATFEADYTAAKKAREVCEFSDISRAAYRLLVDESGGPTALALSIRETYDSIYIDEYQDVDAMQDAIFCAISKPGNRFMVGDIKQSIYRFRGAQPAVFNRYKKAFPPLGSAGSAAAVMMANCFRCDQPIIDFSNTVSGLLFRSAPESVSYTPADDLVFSKKDPPHTDVPCRVLLTLRQKNQQSSDEEEEEEATGAVLEARMIADEIERLVRDGETKNDGKKITYGDIAVMYRAHTHIGKLAAELLARGIPCRDAEKTSFFENAEVLCVYSLLATIDNPFRDVYLAATLRSPFFGFSLEDLVHIRDAADRAASLFEALRAAATDAADAELATRCAAFLDTLENYRKLAKTHPVDRLLREIYRRTAALSLAGEADGAPLHARRANLTRLYEYARKFESGGYKGLYQFIRYVDDLMANGVTMPTPEGETDAVSLITMHHSKGLEFPVCFVAGTAARFGSKDTSPAFLTDEETGCALYLSNGAGPLSLANTYWRQSVACKLQRAAREEEMRVLYVAMTRARERLYLTGCPEETTPEKAQNAAATASDLPILLASSPLEWVLIALERSPKKNFFEIQILTPGDAPAKADATSPAPALADPARVAALKEEFAARFAFAYPYAHLTRLPAKLSVSRLTPEVLDVFDADGSPAPQELHETDVDTLLHTFERTPRFGPEAATADAAQRGTATHEFLQFCDFARAAREGVRAELARLVAARYLSPEAERDVYVDELERFFESAFYHRLSTAREVHREMRFNIFLPAADFTADAAFAEKIRAEKLLVQGVIDLFFEDEDGALVLCDYKTDRLTPAELADPARAAATLGARHGQQLAYYARAVEEICGRAPDRILIYSLPLGAAVDITLP